MKKNRAAGKWFLCGCSLPEKSHKKRPENSRSFVALHLPMKNKPIGMGANYNAKQVPDVKDRFPNGTLKAFRTSISPSGKSVPTQRV
jgi:hypothetical protein